METTTNAIKAITGCAVLALAVGVAPTLASASLPASPIADYTVINVSNGGMIAGRITLSSIPELVRDVAVSADTHICGDRAVDPSTAVGPNAELGGAFVYLEGVEAGKAFDPAPAAIDNQGCVYVPYVQGAPVGGELEVVNSDTALHNVHVHFGRRTLWNIALPLKGFKVPKTLPDRPGILHIACDVHEWMKSVIYLVENPYFATTDAEGNFSLDEVPAGTYTMVVWHKRFGEIRQQVTVAAGATASGDSVLPVE